jgi:hypothetical protein
MCYLSKKQHSGGTFFMIVKNTKRSARVSSKKVTISISFRNEDDLLENNYFHKLFGILNNLITQLSELTLIPH